MIFACDRTGYHSFRVQLVSDMKRTNKHDNRMSVFPVLFIFYNNSGRNQLEYKTYVYDFALYSHSGLIVPHVKMLLETLSGKKMS